MAHKPSNDAVLEQLKNGIAQFELVSSPVPLISTSISRVSPTALFGDYSHRFFAKTGFPLGRGSSCNLGFRFDRGRGPSWNFGFSFDRGRGSSWNLGFTFDTGRGSSWNLGFSFDRGRGSAMMKVETVEYYSVQKVTGDGLCLFRALVKGRAANEGSPVSPREEIINAEELRRTVKQAICENGQESPGYKEAVAAIRDNGESLQSYCQRIQTPNFWGGHLELLVLSELLEQPIIVYEHTNGGRGSGFIPIDKYGSEYSEGSGNRKPMKAVRLLKGGRNRYDLLVSETERE